ncbi:SipW-dependent-type signal peptide-containing protein [Agromyces ramosus]|nr:SipW-dependent-type signal peptide-containing protein [Agromyces ramosus]
METPIDHATTAERTGGGDRRRRTMAIIAGGLVLGVGAAITLAAWNDSEFATGTFGSGQFGIEGSLDGSTFSSSPESPGKTLVFEVDADALAPGDTVYAPFAVQLEAGSTNAADVTIEALSAAAIAADLTYTLIEPTAFGCDETTTGAALVTDAATTASGPTAVFDLAAVTTPLYLCFAVTAGVGLDPSQTGAVTWEFAATSTATLP